jgi:hypothetical protein
MVIRLPTSSLSSSSPHAFRGNSLLIKTLRYSAGATASGTPDEPTLNSFPPRRSFGILLLLLHGCKRKRFVQMKQVSNLVLSD